MSEDELCFVCGKEPLHEDGQCPACWAETQRLMANPPHTAEEKALAELRKVVYDMWFRYRVSSFNLSHAPDLADRLKGLCQLLDWLGSQLDAARKI